MMNYKIKVVIEATQTLEAEHQDPQEKEDGSFEIVIKEADAINIDKCEQAFLRANFPAIREAISRHLSKISKKKP